MEEIVPVVARNRNFFLDINKKVFLKIASDCYDTIVRQLPPI